MRRLLCRLLGHARWQRDGRGVLAAWADWDRHRRAALGPISRLNPLTWLPAEVEAGLAQQYLPFSRSFLCWRCHRWIHLPKPIDMLAVHRALRETWAPGLEAEAMKPNAFSSRLRDRELNKARARTRR